MSVFSAHFEAAGGVFGNAMRSFLAAFAALFLLSGLSARLSFAQDKSSPDTSSEVSTARKPASTASGSILELHATSTMSVASEQGGAFMNGSKCDADGNLYIRKFAVDHPLLGPVVKIDPDGKRTALFDLSAFSQLALDRADAFSPAPDGGIYQIGQSGILKRQIYVLHFSSDGSASSPTRLDADLEVYTFAAFAGGNFLVSGVQRDPQNKSDHGRNFTAAFSADGRELAQLTFPKPQARAQAGARSNQKGRHQKLEATTFQLDLADAETGIDGNLYVMRPSAPAVIYVIAPTGTIVHTLKVVGPQPGCHGQRVSCFRKSNGASVLE